MLVHLEATTYDSPLLNLDNLGWSSDPAQKDQQEVLLREQSFRSGGLGNYERVLRVAEDLNARRAMLLPQVVRWNTPVAGSRYRELMHLAGPNGFKGDAPLALATRLEEMAARGGMPSGLRAVGVSREDLRRLAEAASLQ